MSTKKGEQIKNLSQEEQKKDETEAKKEVKVEEKIVYIEKKDQAGGGVFLWAFVLISAGMILLLNNFGILSGDVWSVLLRFWPLLIVLLGLQLIFGKSIFARWTITLLGLILVAFILILSSASVNEKFNNWLNENASWWPQSWFDNIMGDGELLTKEITIKEDNYEDVESLDLTVDIGLTEFTIKDDNSNNYFDLEATYRENMGEPELTEKMNKGILELNLKTKSTTVFGMWGVSNHKYDITLGKANLPTNLDITLGTGKGVVELDELNINDFKAEVGTGALEITFTQNSLPSGEVLLDLGTGKISLVLPENIGLKINYEIGTGSIEINNDDLEESGIGKRGTYFSDNFDDAKETLELEINVGTGSVEIETK